MLACGRMSRYTLLCFDSKGRERGTDSRLTIAQAGLNVDDIFIMCHGWQGDVPAAIGQYDAWTDVMQRTARSLVLGLHWPSLPFGEERLPVQRGIDFGKGFVGAVRGLSFWRMKDRARKFGECGAAKLLGELKATAPEARIHLMGHSFGCIAVSAMAAAHPVDTLFLVQGAMSCRAFARGGYFATVRPRGAMLVTTSAYDTAVRALYPVAAAIKKQVSLSAVPPAYGALGAYGACDVGAVEMEVGTPLPFERGGIYNLDASAVIRNGDGIAGAHTDIAHRELAEAFRLACSSRRLVA